MSLNVRCLFIFIGPLQNNFTQLSHFIASKNSPHLISASLTLGSLYRFTIPPQLRKKGRENDEKDTKISGGICACDMRFNARVAGRKPGRAASAESAGTMGTGAAEKAGTEEKTRTAEKTASTETAEETGSAGIAEKTASAGAAKKAGSAGAAEKTG
jgi:hypothetical protein